MGEATLYSTQELHKKTLIDRRTHKPVRNLRGEGIEIEVTNPIRTALYQRHPQLSRKERRELERKAARSLRAKLKRGFGNEKSA